MTGPEYTAAAAVALAAYARPIMEHARVTARGVADSARCDAEMDGYDADVWRADQDFAATDPRHADRAMRELGVPTGALPWARETWLEYYRDELPRAFAAARDGLERAA